MRLLSLGHPITRRLRVAVTYDEDSQVARTDQRVEDALIALWENGHRTFWLQMGDHTVICELRTPLQINPTPKGS